MTFYYKSRSYTADEYECNDMEILLQKCRFITKVVLIRRTNTNRKKYGNFMTKMPFYYKSCPYTADEYECNDMEILLQKCRFITKVVFYTAAEYECDDMEILLQNTVLLQKWFLYGGRIRVG